MDIKYVTSEIIKSVITCMQFPPDNINEHMTIQYDLGVDSLEIIMILIELEKKFGLEFDERIFANNNMTIEMLANYIIKKMEEAHAQ